jgi:hypothetical protein
LRLIQVWIAALALIVVAGMTLGMTVSIGTGMMLAALSLAPPAIVLLLWSAAPGNRPAKEGT